MKYKYFCYDSDTGFDTFKTEREASEAAQEAIDSYRDDAFYGWNEEVNSVCWGEIKQEAVKTNEKTTKEAEEEGISISEDCDGCCDYCLIDLK